MAGRLPASAFHAASVPRPRAQSEATPSVPGSALGRALAEIDRSHLAEAAARQSAADAVAARSLEVEATAAAEAELANQRRTMQRQLRAAEISRRAVTVRSAVDGALLREAVAEVEAECTLALTELRITNAAVRRSSADAALQQDTRAAVRAQCERVVGLASAAVRAASPAGERGGGAAAAASSAFAASDGGSCSSSPSRSPMRRYPASASSPLLPSSSPRRVPGAASGAAASMMEDPLLRELVARHEAATEARLSEVLSHVGQLEAQVSVLDGQRARLAAQLDAAERREADATLAATEQVRANAHRPTAPVSVRRCPPRPCPPRRGGAAARGLGPPDRSLLLFVHRCRCRCRALLQRPLPSARSLSRAR